jgi:anaerobic ribonucleoside-triphosphate reductase activating protein
MEERLKIAGVVRESIVDGKGIRFTVFCQGCPHHCPGCHNPQTHAFDGGTEVAVRKIADEIAKDPLLSGVTFSGGEPFCQAGAFAKLADLVHALPGQLDVTCYSGWTYEQLCEKAETEPDTAALLERCDYLIDGPFVMAKRDLTLLFRGSSNQRYLDLRRTRAAGEPVAVE